MPDDASLLYAVVIVFGLALGGTLVARVMGSRLVPLLRARRASTFDANVRRALLSQRPESLAKVFCTSLEGAAEPILHARYWTMLGWLSRRIRGEARRIERTLPKAQASAEALAWALYGDFARAERVVDAGPVAPGDQTMWLLELEFVLHLFRDGDASAALVCAHQGISAAKSPALGAWMPIWYELRRAAEVASGHHTFDEIDEFMRHADNALAFLLLSWAAAAHARSVADNRKDAYLGKYRAVAPYCTTPRNGRAPSETAMRP